MDPLAGVNANAVKGVSFRTPTSLLRGAGLEALPRVRCPHYPLMAQKRLEGQPSPMPLS